MPNRKTPPPVHVKDDSPDDAFDDLDDDIVVEFDPALGEFTGAEAHAPERIHAGHAVSGPTTALPPRSVTGQEHSPRHQTSEQLELLQELYEAMSGAVHRLSGEFEAVRESGSVSWTEVHTSHSHTRPSSATQPAATHTAASQHDGETPQYALHSVSPSTGLGTPADTGLGAQQQTMQLDADDLLSISGLTFPVPPPAPAQTASPAKRPPAPQTEPSEAETPESEETTQRTLEPQPTPGAGSHSTSDLNLESVDALMQAIDELEAEIIPRAEPTLERPTNQAPALFELLNPEEPTNAAAADAPTESGETSPSDEGAPDDILDGMLSDFYGTAPAKRSAERTSHAQYNLGEPLERAPTPRTETKPLDALDPSTVDASAEDPDAEDPSAYQRTGAFGRQSFPTAQPIFGDDAPSRPHTPLETTQAHTPAPAAYPGYFENDAEDDVFEALDEPHERDASSGDAKSTAAETSGTENLLRAYLTGHEFAVEETKSVPRLNTDQLLAAYLSDPLAMPPAPDSPRPTAKPRGRLIDPPAKRRRAGAITERTSGLTRKGEARRIGARLDAADLSEERPRPADTSERGSTPTASPHALEPSTKGHTLAHAGAAAEDTFGALATQIVPTSGVHRKPSRSEDRPRDFSEEGAQRMPRMAANSEDGDTIQLSEQHAIDVLHEYINKRPQGGSKPQTSPNKTPPANENRRPPQGDDD